MGEPPAAPGGAHHLTTAARVVVSVPRWRGAQVRLLDALPGPAVRLAPLILAAGRTGQRRQHRRAGAEPR
ncbi:hypothetical protein ACGF5C_08405 [Micromonospora sp. NPDC047620]|uniref:hypothetical protein n=1 Tax=Micromonospora sp. NPDC047620 TaxID=3364251 RepID=UPI0037240F00